MIKILTACQDHQAKESSVKRLSKKNNRITRVVFLPRRFDHDQHTLNTSPRCLGPV